MKTSLVAALALGLIATAAAVSPALAAPGDAVALRGMLVFPSTHSVEPFVVVRGDDGRLYYVDISFAQRRGSGTLIAGNRVSLTAVQGAKPHELAATAFGPGDAAVAGVQLPTPSALPFSGYPSQFTAFSTPPVATPFASPYGVGSPTTTGTPFAGGGPFLPGTAAGNGPFTTPGTPVPSSSPSALPTDVARPAPAPEGRPWKFDGTVEALRGRTLVLRTDQGERVMVDLSRLGGNLDRLVSPGEEVTVLGAIEGDQGFVARGFISSPPRAERR